MAILDVRILDAFAFFDMVEGIYFRRNLAFFFDGNAVFQVFILNLLHVFLQVICECKIFRIVPRLRCQAREIEKLRERS